MSEVADKGAVEALERLQKAVDHVYEAKAANDQANKDAKERVDQAWHGLKASITEGVSTAPTKNELQTKLTRIEQTYQDYSDAKDFAKTVKNDAKEDLRSAQEALKLALVETKQLRLDGI
jgi:methylthioribose-1-phosphate isomerase